MRNNGTVRWTTLLTLPKEAKVYSAEARATISARNRQIMARKVEAGSYVPPSKDPGGSGHDQRQ